MVHVNECLMLLKKLFSNEYQLKVFSYICDMFITNKVLFFFLNFEDATLCVVSKLKWEIYVEMCNLHDTN